MPLTNDFATLADNGFGQGSEVSGSFTGIKFGTLVEEIQSGDPVFPGHVSRLYKTLTNAATGVEIGINGLVAVQTLKVNDTLTVDTIDVDGLVLTDLTVTDSTVLNDLGMQGSFKQGVSDAFVGITSPVGDIDVQLDPGDDLRFDIRDGAVEYDEIGVSSGSSGFLLADASEDLSWNVLRVGGDLTGDGVNTDLNIADNAVGLDKMEDGNPAQVYTTDTGGFPQRTSMSTFTVLTRSSSAIADTSLFTNSVLGRRGGGIQPIGYDTLVSDLDLTPSDISTVGNSADDTFTGSAPFRFGQDVIVAQDDPTFTLRSAESTVFTTTARLEFEQSQYSASSRIDVKWFGNSNPGGFDEMRLDIVTGDLRIDAEASGSSGQGDIDVFSENDITLNADNNAFIDGDDIFLRASDDVIIQPGGSPSNRTYFSNDGFVFFGGSSAFSSDIAIDIKEGVLLFKSGGLGRVPNQTGSRYSSFNSTSGWVAMYAFDAGGNDVNMNVHEFDRTVNNGFA